MKAPLGTLYLVPNTLDLGSQPVDIQQVLPLGVLQTAARLKHWVAEDAKTTRAFLKRVGEVLPLACPMQEMQISVLPRPVKGSHAPQAGMDALLQAAFEGHDVGLISEAGLPAVADPGSTLVQAAHRQGLRVLPLAGPSSLMLALAASGLEGQSFAFVGYLPQDASARAVRIRELEAASRKARQTQLMIETPYRNAALMQALLQHLGGGTRLSVACGLTLERGWCRTLSVAQWRALEPDAQPQFDKDLPAVFSFLA